MKSLDGGYIVVIGCEARPECESCVDLWRGSVQQEFGVRQFWTTEYDKGRKLVRVPRR